MLSYDPFGVYQGPKGFKPSSLMVPLRTRQLPLLWHLRQGKTHAMPVSPSGPQRDSS